MGSNATVANSSYVARCVKWPPGQLCPDGSGSTDVCSCKVYQCVFAQRIDFLQPFRAQLTVDMQVKCAGKPANSTQCDNNWWELFVDTGQWAAPGIRLSARSLRAASARDGGGIACACCVWFCLFRPLLGFLEPAWDCDTFKSYSDPGRLDKRNACWSQLCWATPSES